MTISLHASCGRALVSASASKEPGLGERLLRSIAWELHNEAGSLYRDLAIVVRRENGSFLCARGGDDPALPDETLVGLLCDCVDGKLMYRVKDHAIDGGRFVSVGCRSSIMVRLALPECVQEGEESALWLGLLSAASPLHVEEARSLGRALEEWFAVYSPVVSVLEQRAASLQETSRQLREASSLAHDARAPLSLMRRMVEESLDGTEAASENLAAVLEEFAYLETLLGRCSPQALRDASLPSEQCDLRIVVERVKRRFGGAASGHKIGVEFLPGGEHFACRLSELECERILSNIVSNAVQHGGDGAVLISVQARSESVVCEVRDSGPGFPPALLQELGATATDVLHKASGWGTGLLCSRRRLERGGGSLHVRNEGAGGAVVTIRFPGAGQRRDLSRLTGSAADNCDALCGGDSASLLVVDDDSEHAETLAKLLLSRGIKASCFSSVDDALKAVKMIDLPVLCDVRMPGGGAEKLIRMLRQDRVVRRVAVMSGDADEHLLWRLAAHGAESFFLKPVEIDEVEKWHVKCHVRRCD